ncbi:MAG: hypothetical protein KQH53_19115 [Desulfarculaceae bacterium]|nr:hypothetical protein [Desulfarculaceae bacterium]
MLVFISDLHLVDGTVGGANVSPEAFKTFAEDLAWMAGRRHEVTEIKVVLLGDVFDVLRTKYWFTEKENGHSVPTPWDVPPPPPAVLEKQVFKVLMRVIDNSHAQLKALRDVLLQVEEKIRRERGADSANGIKVELVYLAGNHDRLVNLFPITRAVARLALGMEESSERFEVMLEDEAHGVLALHGHQFDKHNYEKVGCLDQAPHDAVPIGDPITTMLISRLPFVVKEQVRECGGCPSDDQERLEKNFRELGDVRPITATTEWLTNQVELFPNLEEAIEKGIDQALEEFENLQFVKDWMKLHDRTANIFDEADKLQISFRLLKWARCLALGRLLCWVSRLRLKYNPRDRHAEGAADLLERYDPGGQGRFRYVVMGHTHNPLQTPLAIVPPRKKKTRKGGAAACAGPAGQEPRVERAYLNSGTWRRRQHHCLEGCDFQAWGDMTWVVIYKPEELLDEKGNKPDGPEFDTWTGHRSFKTGRETGRTP